MLQEYFVSLICFQGFQILGYNQILPSAGLIYRDPQVHTRERQCSKPRHPKPLGAALEHDMNQRKNYTVHASLCSEITSMTAEETNQTGLDSGEKDLVLLLYFAEPYSGPSAAQASFHSHIPACICRELKALVCRSCITLLCQCRGKKKKVET